MLLSGVGRTSGIDMPLQSQLDSCGVPDVSRGISEVLSNAVMWYYPQNPALGASRNPVLGAQAP